VSLHSRVRTTLKYMPVLPTKYISSKPKDKCIPVDSNNKEKDPRYALAEWKNRYSIEFRTLNPRCAHCNRLFPYYRLAVDHIIPLYEGGSFWDRNNHQSLCISCHSRKTVKEQKGSKTPFKYNEENEKIPL
jgi:5-methylcytosine-specific restriction protein A